MGFRVFSRIPLFLFLIFGFLGLCLGLDFLFKFSFVLPLLGFRVFFFGFLVFGFVTLLGFWVFFFPLFLFLCYRFFIFVLPLLIFDFCSSVIFGFVLS